MEIEKLAQLTLKEYKIEIRLRPKSVCHITFGNLKYCSVPPQLSTVMYVPDVLFSGRTKFRDSDGRTDGTGDVRSVIAS